MTNAQTIALELFRSQLQRAIEPIDISAYHEELVRDLEALKCCGDDKLSSTLANHLRVLKETQQKVIELEHRCNDAKALENKMQYSTEVKDIAVAKKKVSELSREINHLLRTSDLVLQNLKRFKVDAERIDAIVFKTIKDLPDLSVLKQATSKYTPIDRARDKAFEEMKQTLKELDEIHTTILNEQTEHREIVEDTKMEIKRTKEDIIAISNCNHAMQTSFDQSMTDRGVSRADEIKTKRQGVHDEIEKLKIEARDAAAVHEANKLVLENERADLVQRLEAAKRETSSAINELDAQLDELRIEHSSHAQALECLGQRKCDEAKEFEEAAAQERLRHEKKIQIKAREEKEHFAALWIQLRWKVHVKRQRQKLASKGKKKGGKKKGKK